MDTKVAVVQNVETVKGRKGFFKVVYLDDNTKYNCFKEKLFIEKGKKYEIQLSTNGEYTNIEDVIELGAPRSSGAAPAPTPPPPVGDAPMEIDSVTASDALPYGPQEFYDKAFNKVMDLVAARVIEYNPTNQNSVARLKDEIKRWANYLFTHK